MRLGENKADTKIKFRWQIGMAIILLIIVTIYLFKLINARPEEDYKKSGELTEPVIAVVAEAATQEDFPVYLSGLGTVTALRTVTVRSRVDGELIRVAFKKGQMVHAS